MAANKEGNEAIWRIREHFGEHGLFYWSAIVCLVFIAALLTLAGWKRSSDGFGASEVMKWERVEATIVSSEISEIDTSDETSFSTRISANVLLRYEVGGKPRETEYFASWRRTDLKDWDARLAPGMHLPIRISPEDAQTVSLFDLIGVP